MDFEVGAESRGKHCETSCHASPAEVINDASGEVANLFRVLQRHFVPMMDMLRWQVTSRTEFERLRLAVPGTLTDMERAVRFLYLQRNAWGGKVRGQNFGVNPSAPARFDVTKLAPILEAVHDRLAGVTIECLGWEELLHRYDRPDALIYMDPPYWGSESDYGDGLFGKADFARMAEVLAGLKGSWLLSLNDTPGVRECFAGFEFERVETSYSIAGGKRQGGKVGEVIISRPAPKPRGPKGR
ncbi:DNA adenine methylase [Humitalea sp. 24SJ18S-53]|uniref:DNA adenine methylase n=1 Tax=Humitalea sp. 24SJ18S-53 TaxID=3422307 RepID=UPI003D6744F2